MSDQPEITEDDFDYCQDCGDMISFEDGTAYVTASGDVYCFHCGRAMDEAEEADWEDDWDSYGTSYDLIEGEEYGVDIGADNDTIYGGGDSTPPDPVQDQEHGREERRRASNDPS